MELAAPEALHAPAAVGHCRTLPKSPGLGTALLYSAAPLCLPPSCDPDSCYSAGYLGLKPATVGAEKSARNI